MTLADFQKQLSQLEAAGLLRKLRTVSSPQTPQIQLDGRGVYNFSSNNYLGLAAHPALVAAAQEALADYGWGAGAAALISGEMKPHEDLRQELCRCFNIEAALLFNSGYHANVGALPALGGDQSAFFSDSLNHASIIDGLRLAHGQKFIYRHADCTDLERQLRAHTGTGTRWIVTESIFSMDGDRAPLRDLCALAERYEAGLYLDEAHAVGILGQRNAGLWDELELASERVPGLLRMGTFGKAFGSYGAFMLGTEASIGYMLNKARTFIFTTNLPPAVAAVNQASLKLVQAEPERRQRLWARIEQLAQALNVPGTSAIFPWLIPGNHAVMAASDALLQHGCYVQAIRSPTVAAGTERLRLTLSSEHSSEAVRTLADKVLAL